VTKIALQEKWQDGPASIDVVTDLVTLDGGQIGPAVLIEIETSLLLEDAALELGVLRCEIPATKAEARLMLAASYEQARQLRDALTEIIDAAIL